MIFVDIHTHTSYSHGSSTVEEMFNAGQKKGLKIYGFSEHSPRPKGYDYPVDYKGHLELNFPHYVSEVQSLATNQAESTVLLGVEIDWLANELIFIQDIVNKYPYDYCLAGIHFIGTWGFDASADDWAILSLEEKERLYVFYYEAMIEMAETGLFHVAAHPDLIKIFSVDDFHRWLSLNMHLVEKALCAIKKAGMAMEVSSAGLRKPCNEIYPCVKIMELAKNVGVPISFASDAHCVNTVGKDFDILADYAKSFGFTKSLYFQKGEAVELAF